MTTGKASQVRTWPRRVGLLGLSLITAPVLVVGTMSTPAHAATGTFSEPPAGATYTTGATLIVKARISRGLNDTGKVTMTMQLPASTTEYEVASHSGGSTSGGGYDLQYTFDPSCPSFPGIACQGRPTYNGTHIVRLRGTSSPVERSFVMRVPPKKPTGVTASTTDRTHITVRWDRGSEPDLTGYDLFTDGDKAVARGIAPDRNEYVVEYPQSGGEGTHSFYVVAHRRACAGCADTLASPRSESASATIEAPPPPPPSADPSYEPEPSPTADTGGGGGSGSSPSTSPGATPGSGGGSSGSPAPGASGGTGTSGTGTGTNPSASGQPGSSSAASPSSGSGKVSAPVIAQRQAFALQFRSFAPKLGAPKLPPLPNFDDPEFPEEEGTYEETLDFGEQDIEELITSAQGGGERSIVEEFVSTAFEGRRLWSSVGWGLVLFLIAGHLRRWLNAPQHH
ncbi:MAG TPA: hypothetical protein VNA14_09015 [Mycobacteriales bacterium]|nr:hypothetical protein [Mycobacteriales bacterium]